MSQERTRFAVMLRFAQIKGYDSDPETIGKIAQQPQATPELERLWIAAVDAYNDMCEAGGRLWFSQVRNIGTEEERFALVEANIAATAVYRVRAREHYDAFLAHHNATNPGAPVRQQGARTRREAKPKQVGLFDMGSAESAFG